MKSNDVHHASPVPVQHEGDYLDSSASLTASTRDEAMVLFSRASKRLLNVDSWDHYAGMLSATFALTDNLGKEKGPPPVVGDYFKINIPGPGPIAGDGFDWVKVESLEDIVDNDADTEIRSITVRPASNPRHHDAEPAHFFSNSATSTFLIKREGLLVSAFVHGRNEVPNTSVENQVDRIRNSAIALGATSGFSKMQWKALCKGLLEDLQL
jgi:hypothetical protein